MNTIASKKTHRGHSVENIPVLCTQDQEDFNLLVKWREEMQEMIIRNIIEYEIAHWSEVPGSKIEIPAYMQVAIDDNRTVRVKELTNDFYLF